LVVSATVEFKFGSQVESGAAMQKASHNIFVV